MRRMALVALLSILLTGCGSISKAPVRGPDQSAPAPVVEPKVKPEVSEPCRGPVTDGPPAIVVRVAGIWMPLPMANCAISLPAGKVSLSLLISNLQKPQPVKVTGAPDGRWDGDRYLLDFDLTAGQFRNVGLDMSAYGQVTYTFRGDPSVPAVLSSGPSRQGPWSPVKGELVLADHGWLRISYPRPMKAGSPSLISADQYAQPGQGLSGEWEGEQVQYLEIGKLGPVLFVNPTADQNGLQLMLEGARQLYRGAPPELQRVAPATGGARTVYPFTDVPRSLAYLDGLVRWQEGDLLRLIDPTTGKISAAPSPAPTVDERLSFPSPDGKLVAEVSFPDGMPGRPTENKPLPATLIIRESGTGKRLVQLDRWLTSWGTFSCTRGTPGLGWRADSHALAVLDAPEADRLLLKEVDLNAATRTVADWKGPGAGLGQLDYEVIWAPSGKMIVVGARLVDANTGRVLAEQLPRHTFWSPDSKNLLLYGPDHPFTPWGAVGLLEVETGKRLALGHGQGLGWTPQGEALLVRWDVSKQIPAPGKGCP
jgi:hypothetical protein